MKIAFTGSHSTGKTTLLNDAILRLKNKRLSYITEIARNIINRGYPLNMDANIDSYVHYINDQLKAEKAMCESSIFISDRTLLDPLAYSLVNRDLPRPFIPDHFISMMEGIWLLEKDNYDLYMYFPIEFPMCSDGVRPTDEVYRSNVSNKILELLTKYKVPHIHVTGSPTERLNILLDTLTL